MGFTIDKNKHVWYNEKGWEVLRPSKKEIKMKRGNKMASATYNKKEKWGVSATALYGTRSEPGWRNEVEESLMFEFFVFRNPPDMCGIITNDFTARSIYLASTKKILEMAKDFSVTSRFGRWASALRDLGAISLPKNRIKLDRFRFIFR